MGVEDGAGGWVREAAPFVFEEESLGNPLVNDDHGDLGGGSLVVELLDGFAELGDLSGEDLLSHGITDTVAVNDEVGRLLSFVAFLKAGDGLPDQILHLVIDDLCSLGHEQVVRVVLGHRLVGACSEADHGLTSRMADIDTDEHGADLVHDCRELHLEEVSTHLRVDLAQDVRRFGGVEGTSISVRDDLRGHSELVKDQFVLAVQVLSEEDDHNHGRVTERPTRKHILVEVVLEILNVLFAVELDPLRLLNLHAKLPAGHLESLEDLVGRVVLPGTVDEDPLFLLQVNRVLHRKPPERLLVTVDDLVLLPDLGLAEHVRPQLDRIHLKLQTPVSDTLLLEQVSAHLLDLLDLLLRSNPGLGQSVTHATSFSDLVRDAVDQAELRREVEVAILVLDEEEGLLGVGHVHVVTSSEVLSHASLLALVLERHGERIRGELNVGDDVGALVAPVGDDRVTGERGLDQGFPVVLTFGAPLHLVDLGETRFGAHELEDAVDAQHGSELALDRGRLEPAPHLQFCLRDHDRVLDVEEAGCPAHLLQIGVPESVVDDDVEDLAHGGLGLGHFGSLSHVDLDHRVLIDHDRLSLSPEDTPPVHRLVDLSKSPNGLARDDEGTETGLHLTSLGLDDGLDTVRIPQLHRLDLHAVLTDLQRSAQFQPELIAGHVDRSGAFGVRFQREGVIGDGFVGEGHHLLLVGGGVGRGVARHGLAGGQLLWSDELGLYLVLLVGRSHGPVDGLLLDPVGEISRDPGLNHAQIGVLLLFVVGSR